MGLNFISQAGFIYGLLLSAVLALAGYFSLKWANGKSQNIFTSVLLGGFLLRLVVFGIALVWVWKFSSLNGSAFTIALLGSYLIFQTVETVILQRQVKTTKTMDRAQKA